MSDVAVESIEWRGVEALRPFLVGLHELEPFPGNPRHGNVEAIRDSLGRFGQLKPIVVDGRRIVAGHHIVQAAQDLGWEQVAAVDHEFASENEQRAFLLADNRTSELGWFDTDALLEQLKAIDDLHGTGYDDDYIASLRNYVAELNPEIGSLDVDAAALARAAQGMGPATGGRTLVEAMCPACGHAFYLAADDLPSPGP